VLLLCFGDAGRQAGADLGQPGTLGRVGAKQRAAQAPLTELTTMFQQFMAGFGYWR
jgi:hypothetical protein